ncbi:IclR family transcriptional regulator [Microbacterium sp. ISL-108]|nr:IclR family transcriptional regulator [Microbacterium sp. ISL-108]RKN64819.1 IclR family transcriptional regulator [Microbacterium sp. CGR2]
MGDDTSADTDRVVGADRVLAVLAELAEHPEGITLDQMAQQLRGAKSTVHRALAALRRAGFAELQSRGVYVLGDEFLRLAFRNQAGRPESARIEPVLKELVDKYGETAHFAVLEGVEVVYRAKVDPPGGAVRLTSEVGGRNPAYRTGVGKMLLSAEVESEKELEKRLGTATLPSRTEHTITSVAALWRELERTKRRGYAVDDQENEMGVNCIAVPVRRSPDLRPIGAVSISALAFRTPLERLEADAAEITAIVDKRLGAMT